MLRNAQLHVSHCAPCNGSSSANVTPALCCKGEDGAEKKKKKKRKAAPAAAALRIVDEDATGFRSGPAARMQGDEHEDVDDEDEGGFSCTQSCVLKSAASLVDHRYCCIASVSSRLHFRDAGAPGCSSYARAECLFQIVFVTEESHAITPSPRLLKVSTNAAQMPL